MPRVPVSERVLSVELAVNFLRIDYYTQHERKPAGNVLLFF